MNKDLARHRPSCKEWWCLTSWLKRLQLRKFRHFFKQFKKKKGAQIYKLVRRLKEVQFKVINDGVTKMKTDDLVQTLIDPLLKIKSRCPTTQ